MIGFMEARPKSGNEVKIQDWGAERESNRVGFFYIYAMNSKHRIDNVLNNIKNWLESIIYICHSTSTHWSAYIGSGGPNKEYK